MPFKGTLINVKASGNLTLENITVDGQGDVNGIGGTVEAEAPMIEVAVQLNSEIIIKNMAMAMAMTLRAM